MAIWKKYSLFFIIMSEILMKVQLHWMIVLMNMKVLIRKT